MARTLVDCYQIDGKPMLAPDHDPEFSFSDLDSSDSGRDESGYMHRVRVREGVGTWGFEYAHLKSKVTGEWRNHKFNIIQC